MTPAMSLGFVALVTSVHGQDAAQQCRGQCCKGFDVSFFDDDGEHAAVVTGFPSVSGEIYVEYEDRLVRTSCHSVLHVGDPLNIGQNVLQDCCEYEELCERPGRCCMGFDVSFFDENGEHSAKLTGFNSSSIDLPNASSYDLYISDGKQIVQTSCHSVLHDGRINFDRRGLRDCCASDQLCQGQCCLAFNVTFFDDTGKHSGKLTGFNLSSEDLYVEDGEQIVQASCHSVLHDGAHGLHDCCASEQLCQGHCCVGFNVSFLDDKGRHSARLTGFHPSSDDIYVENGEQVVQTSCHSVFHDGSYGLQDCCEDGAPEFV